MAKEHPPRRQMLLCIGGPNHWKRIAIASNQQRRRPILTGSNGRPLEGLELSMSQPEETEPAYDGFERDPHYHRATFRWPTTDGYRRHHPAVLWYTCDFLVWSTGHSDESAKAMLDEKGIRS